MGILNQLNLSESIKKGFKWNWSLHLSGYLCLYQQAFESMKALSVADTALMCYPDHNFPVHFFTDVSDFQLRKNYYRFY